MSRADKDRRCFSFSALVDSAVARNKWRQMFHKQLGYDDLIFAWFCAEVFRQRLGVHGRGAVVVHERGRAGSGHGNNLVEEPPGGGRREVQEAGHRPRGLAHDRDVARIAAKFGNVFVDPPQ